MSIAECIVLIVVVVLAMGAIFATLGWSSRNYTFSREEMKARELLFNWVQIFESLWPNLYGDVDEALAHTSTLQNGSWDENARTSQIDGFTIAANEQEQIDGGIRLAMRVFVGNVAGGRLVLNTTRDYNAFSNETVSDDSLK
jgi:hypothetical protein